jgi:hypothetical protein
LKIPVTIIAGSEDWIVGHKSHAQWLHDQIPGSDLQIIPEAGHMLHYAAPLQVTAAVDTVSQKATRRYSMEEPKILDPLGQARIFAARAFSKWKLW